MKLQKNDDKYLAVGCHKTMDIIFNTKINISIVYDKLKKTDISKKR
jgi:hypothetical protein